MNRELKAEIVRPDGSQFAFSHRIGMHEAVLSRIVRGRIEPNDEVKQQISEALG